MGEKNLTNVSVETALKYFPTTQSYGNIEYNRCIKCETLLNYLDSPKKAFCGHLARSGWKKIVKKLNHEFLNRDHKFVAIA